MALRSAAEYIPARPTLARLREAADSCQGCDLYKRATQTVFGEGKAEARVVFVGEQPGDVEDRQGRPFVGPAGRLLDKALEEVGWDRKDVYVTNAVKHFKWEPLGNRRKHKKPLVGEMMACRPWLEAELAEIRPQLIVCLGVTAAQTMLKRPVVLRQDRGTFVEGPFGTPVFLTIHPSALLRVEEPEEQEQEYARFVQDLTTARNRLKRLAAAPGG